MRCVILSVLAKNLALLDLERRQILATSGCAGTGTLRMKGRQECARYILMQLFTRTPVMRACGLALLVAIIASDVSGAPPVPATQQVRGAVEQSLPYLEKVSTAWMQARNCNSCHNVTFLIWSENEAAARGFDVDRRKLSQWTKWALADAQSPRFWFKLRPRAMEALRPDLPGPLLGKLKPLEGKTFLTKDDYLHALEQAIGSEDLAANKDRLIKAATLPNNGGGPDTLAQLLLGRATSIADEREHQSYEAVRSLLLQWQEPDGSWQAQGQLPAVKWASDKEMHACTTMWSLLAISPGDPSDPAIARARESLKNDPPGITIQSLALQLMIAHRFNEADREGPVRKALLARQNPDGGWSWIKNKSSDAFSTGQVLYALGVEHRDANTSAIARACQFLIQTQQKDGSWHVPQEAINTRHRNLNVYDYWGTAWATIGLLQTLPPTHATL